MDDSVKLHCLKETIIDVYRSASESFDSGQNNTSFAEL